VAVGTDTPPPGSTALLDAYPNPVRGRLHLAFNLGQAGPVNVDLYDLLGRRVRTLADGAYPGGRQILDADVGDLAPGVYLLRLKTDAGTVTRRVVVLDP
jgi:hypothetical protein